MPIPDGTVDIIKLKNGVVTTYKWIRDSWARKKIVALQQAVSSIVVPTRTSQLTNDSGYITQADVPPGSVPSSTTPKMDGTATVGTENAFARGDHRHPSDTNKADKATTLSGYGITDAYTKSQVDGMIPTVPSNVSAFTNDAGYLTSYVETDPTVPAWAKANTKPSYTASEVGALPANTPIPSKTSDLTNDSGFITGYTETDPTVPSWAKASTKPTYTANEVGALPNTTVIPSKTSELTNDSGFQTVTEVSNAISAEAGLLVPYGYCTTGASTVAKTVTVSPAVTELTTGLTIAVKMQYANTGSNPTLNVNGLGAKAIKRYGTTAPGTSAAANWNANSVVILVYDGTYWQLADWNNTTYSGMTDAEYQAGTSTTNRLITPARLKSAIELHAPVQSVNGQTGAVTVNVPTKTSDLTNDSGFITSAPVTSVNGQTGAVNLDAADVGALPDSTTIPSKTSDLTNDSGFAVVSSGTPTFNNTSYNLNYVSSASGKWQRIGNIVVFNVTYTMKGNISSSLANVFTGMPECDGYRHFLSESTTSEIANRHVTVSGTSISLAGAHSSGTTYHASGAYIAKS